VTPFRHPASRRRLSGLILIRLSAVGLLAAAAGCSSADAAPTVSVPHPPAQQVKLCQSLHKALPSKVGGLERDDPKPRSELTASWGNGVIVLRCGLPRPAEMNDPNAVAVQVGKVNWMLQQQNSRSLLTTTYRKAYVQVTLTSRFAHDASPLIDLATPVSRTIPSSV